jgi:hypothetical protein
MRALELIGPATLLQTSLAGRLHQPQDLFRYPLRFRVTGARRSDAAGGVVVQNGCAAVPGAWSLFSVSFM